MKVAVLFLWDALFDERGVQIAFQSLNGPSLAKPVTILYVSYETPPTWRARFPYLYPPP
jgi:hypothetical protein